MGLESKRSNRLLTLREHNMKKTVFLASIILTIASAIMFTLSIVHKNIGLVVYDAFLIVWNIINLIFAIKLLKDD